MVSTPGSKLKRQPILPDRLFLALKPEFEAALRIKNSAQEIGGRLSPPPHCIDANRLHLSLLSFGDYAGLPRPLIESIDALVSNIEKSAVEIIFDRVSHFGGGAVVLRNSRPLRGITALRLNLLNALSVIPIVRMVNTRNFEPHLTIFYSAKPVGDVAVEPIVWRADRLQLVHSLVGRSQHQTRANWPLTANSFRDGVTEARSDLFAAS